VREFGEQCKPNPPTPEGELRTLLKSSFYKWNYGPNNSTDMKLSLRRTLVRSNLYSATEGHGGTQRKREPQSIKFLSVVLLNSVGLCGLTIKIKFLNLHHDTNACTLSSLVSKKVSKKATEKKMASEYELSLCGTP
jgi:hypothetical protein